MAGFRPFCGATSFELAARILSNDPVPFSALVPQAFRDIIERCLVTCPTERYQTAHDLASALDQAMWQWQSLEGVAGCEI